MLDGRYFHEYPYTDFHELNTDWIINEELEIRKRIEDYLKKIDDLLRKQADLDKKVDDVTNHVNDVENEVNNKIGDITKHIDDAENRINKKIDDADKHVDDVEKKVNDIQPKIDEQNQKINDIDNKNNENQTKINDSVKSVSYDNDLDISDGNVKLIGRIHVEKPNTGDVATPVYGYVGGGTLGNCVVWSKTPYVGIGEQKDYVMKNPKDDTLMEFPINGSFLATCNNTVTVIANGSISDYGGSLVGKILITSDSFVCNWTEHDTSHDTRIIIPKTASGISFEEATHHLEAESGQHLHFEIPFNPDHLYLVNDTYFRAYVVNGSITIIKPDENRTLKIENGKLIFENTYDSEDDIMFLDLGSMV
jgi:prefoldin subunit 5